MTSLIDRSAPDACLSKYYSEAESQFQYLLELDELDLKLESDFSTARIVDEAVSKALASAYVNGQGDHSSHLFLQRILYRINRLKFFWYDDLTNYKNERSDYLRKVRDRIESAWEPWERAQVPLADSGKHELSESLRRRAAEDLSPQLSREALYFRDRMGKSGYKKLLEIASLDALVEASQLSRTLGGVSNQIQAMMTRLLVEEYGGGRLSRKHSSFFSVMLAELQVDAAPEAHFRAVPWEVLATINHSFLLSERKLFYLRYVGGLLYTETSVPAAFSNYRLAADRLGLSDKARAYWDIHIREDERHGRWMLNDVALPLAEMYPGRASDIVLGYDQQKFMSDRAGMATAAAVMQADQATRVEDHGPSQSFEVAA